MFKNQFGDIGNSLRHSRKKNKPFSFSSTCKNNEIIIIIGKYSISVKYAWFVSCQNSNIWKIFQIPFFGGFVVYQENNATVLVLQSILTNCNNKLLQVQLIGKSKEIPNTCQTMHHWECSVKVCKFYFIY